jgi:hypothetical protein
MDERAVPPWGFQRHGSWVGAVVGTVLWLAICGCGDDVRGLALDELHAGRLQSRCEFLQRCGLIADRETCVTYFRAPRDGRLRAAVDAGKIRYDAVAARRCLDALAVLGCDQTSREARAPLEACARMFSGTIEVGEECVFDGECVSGSCSAPECPADTCCYGVCLPTAFARLGEQCTTDEECVPEAFCRGGLCVALSQKGQPCKLDNHCDYGLACIGATEQEDGACRALPLIGESCPYSRCAEIGAYCSASQICTPVGLPGAPCADDTACSPYAQCGANDTCEDIPGLGMPCQKYCAGEAWCNRSSGQGICSTPQENHSPCVVDEQCASLHCEVGSVFTYCAEQTVCL